MKDVLWYYEKIKQLHEVLCNELITIKNYLLKIYLPITPYKMIINNFEKFPFIRDEQAYMYFFQILDRSKKGNNKNRCVKSFYISSYESFLAKQEEMIILAEATDSRVYVHPARRDKNRISLELLSYVATRLAEANDCNKMWRAYESVCGRNKWVERMWIVDVDTKDEFVVWDTIQHIDSIGWGTPYFINETVNWFHLIYNKGFNRSKYSLSHQIHANNPTLIYYNQKILV